MVLGWLLWIQNVNAGVNLNIPNVVSKVAGLQGVSADNLLDLQIYGLAKYLGYGNYTWAQLDAVAKAAVDGQGVLYQGLSRAMTSPDFDTLVNYCRLTSAKVIADTV